MRSASLLGVIAALVIVGLLVRRQLTAVRMATPQSAHTLESRPGQPPITEQVQGAVDELMRQRETQLQRLED